MERWKQIVSDEMDNLYGVLEILKEARFLDTISESARDKLLNEIRAKVSGTHGRLLILIGKGKC